MKTITNELISKFEAILKELDLDVSKFLEFNELSKEQNKIIENAIDILKDNTVDEVKKFGGNAEKHKDKIEAIKEKIKSELEKEDFKEVKSDLEKVIDSYIKIFQQIINKTCTAVIPVKQMPFVDVYFRTVPRLSIDKDKPQKMSINEGSIAYYGEIKCVTPRIILLAKINGEEPLFAPLIGELDLGDFKIDESEQKGPKVQIQQYVSALITSMDKDANKNNVSRYNEQYQRHGEPICDYLLKDKELMEAIKKLSSAIESKRSSSKVGVCGIAVPDNRDQSTVIIVIDESGGSNSYEICFEVLLRFGAACCEAPSAPSRTQAPTQAGQPQTQAPQQPGQVVSPSGQKLETWTPEDLAEDATKRGVVGDGVPPGLEVWTEDALEEVAKTRTNGGINLPVWSEKELEELSKTRQGSLNLPEWKESEDMTECKSCGYGLRPGWESCPVCDWKVGSPVTEQKKEQVKTETPAEKTEEPKGESEGISEEKKEE